MPTRIVKYRQKAFSEQAGRCYYCMVPVWDHSPEAFTSLHSISRRLAPLLRCTAEHLHPKGAGGRDTASNIVAACAFCNQTRHRARIPLEPMAFLRRVRSRMMKRRWHSAAVHRLLRGDPEE
jgi:hypothetical protein